MFLSYEDGWPHLYSISAAASAIGATSQARHPASKALLLTPGPFMVEFVSLTPDRKFVIYNANTGGEKDDIERRHLFKVPVNAATPVALTRGTGLEWSPVITASGRTLAYFAATAQKPRAAVRAAARYRQQRRHDRRGDARARGRSGAEGLPHRAARHAGTRHVQGARRHDGARTVVHAAGRRWQRASGGARCECVAHGAASGARKPAVVFAHGGPPRQMLLGWHYRFYYANSYALNQYLASRGFVVLSVNYPPRHRLRLRLPSAA